MFVEETEAIKFNILFKKADCVILFTSQTHSMRCQINRKMKKYAKNTEYILH